MDSKKNYTLISEIGCNHQGDLQIAKKMMIDALNCGCQIVKFQKRTPKLQFSEEKYNSPHPTPENAFGKTYGEHRENLEFSVTQHKELMLFAKENGLEYSCSIFDSQSTEDILSIQPEHIKIPSPINHRADIIEHIAKNFNGIIHVSLGMTTHEEERNLINILEKYNKLQDTILYHCVSAYPTEDKDASLLEITRLKNLYGNKIKALGLSAHHINSYLPDCIALTLGANYIERHFTFDKAAKGSDHKISLNVEEMKNLNAELKKTSQLLNFKQKEILDCEQKTRQFHKDNFLKVTK
ncbi:N-acetylneuraminate synthase family protein [bacterium]|nr:N-acetylneuraminate synthase family protein [bacterium]